MAVALLPLLGCRGAADQVDASRIQASYDKESGRLTRLAYDANGNGTHDTWAYMDGARLVRLEADENENGRLDRWEYYPDQAGSSGARPAPERIERATRDDGRVSRREFFENGAMTRVEEDTNADGRLDKWETYKDGTLATLALDTSGRGTPDRRFLYKPDGSLDRVEVDRHGTGEFVRDDRPSPGSHEAPLRKVER